MSTLEWFPRFLGEHLRRHKGLADPATEDGRVSYETWARLLSRVEGIDYHVATAASERLLIEPVGDRKHFSTLVAYCREEIRRHKPTTGLAAYGTRAEAEAASRHCERCQGGGLVPLWHDDPEHVPPTCAGHCVCSLGRWMRQKLGAGGREGEALVARIPDVDAVIRGLGPWRLGPPSSRVHRPVF